MKQFIRTITRISLRLFLLAGLLAGLLAVSGIPAAYATTQTVSTCDETSLNAAITTAAVGDIITFSCSGTITLTSTLNITKKLTIDGTGQSVTISGNNAVQVMIVNSGILLNLNTITIANGKCLMGPPCNGIGGGIFNNGTLNVLYSTISNNSAGDLGGGIFNNGTLNVFNSTFSGNTANTGGGIFNNGILNVTNGTFSGNSANTGGGIYGQNVATATLRNTIIANSPSGGNCALLNSAILSAVASNMADDNTCDSATQKTTAQINLGPLANNGGSTQTIA